MTSHTPTVVLPETTDYNMPLKLYLLHDCAIHYGAVTFIVQAFSEEDAYQLAEIAPEERSHYHVQVFDLKRQFVECIYYVE